MASVFRQFFMRKPTQISLRGLLVLVSAIALLLSQYPFVETRDVAFVSPQPAGPARWINTPTVGYRMARRPTRGFIAVATIEGLLLLGWLYRRQRQDCDYDVTGMNPPRTDSIKATRRR